MSTAPLVAQAGPELGIGSWQAAIPPGSGVVLIDDAVRESVATALPCDTLIIPVHQTADAGTVRATALLIEQADPTWVVGIGGGATMDLAKLAAVAAEHPGFMTHIESASIRCGHIRLPRARRRRRLHLVPTTIGTGSESSQGACFDHPLEPRSPGERARTLVTSPALAANQAWLDSSLLTSLPEILVREGLVEALSRVLVSAVVSPSFLAPPEWEAEMLAGRILALLGRITGTHSLDEHLLREASIASTLTHRGTSLLGRGPAPSPLWFVATEMSMTTHTRKNQAICALLGHWARLVMDGHHEWGDPERLTSMWPLGGEDPQTVIRYWGLVDHVTCAPGMTLRSVERIEQRWGGRLPMMSRFSRPQLLTLVEGAMKERNDG